MFVIFPISSISHSTTSPFCNEHAMQPESIWIRDLFLNSYLEPNWRVSEAAHTRWSARQYHIPWLQSHKPTEHQFYHHWLNSPSKDFPARQYRVTWKWRPPEPQSCVPVALYWSSVPALHSDDSGCPACVGLRRVYTKHGSWQNNTTCMIIDLTRA